MFNADYISAAKTLKIHIFQDGTIRRCGNCRIMSAKPAVKHSVS